MITNTTVVMAAEESCDVSTLKSMELMMIDYDDDDDEFSDDYSDDDGDDDYYDDDDCSY